MVKITEEEMGTLMEKSRGGDQEAIKQIRELKNNHKKIEKLFTAYNSKDDHSKNLRTISCVITKRCNLKCPFCVWDKRECNKNEFIPLETLEIALREGRLLGYEFISLTGGEAYLHPQFKEIIKLIIFYDYKFTIVSNALKWEEYKFLVENPKIKEKFDSLALSLDGRKEVHDKYRCTGCFDKVIEALRFFKNKVNISIKMAIGSHNYREIIDVLKISYESGVHDVEIFGIVCMPDFTLNAEMIREIYDLINKNDILLIEYKKKMGIEISLLEINSFDFCPRFKDKSIELLPNGDCVYCCGMDYPEFVLGNIREKTFDQLLRIKAEKTKKIIWQVMNVMLEPYIININLKDRCSFCRWALECKESRNDVTLIYPSQYKVGPSEKI